MHQIHVLFENWGVSSFTHLGVQKLSFCHPAHRSTNQFIINYWNVRFKYPRLDNDTCTWGKLPIPQSARYPQLFQQSLLTATLRHKYKSFIVPIIGVEPERSEVPPFLRDHIKIKDVQKLSERGPKEKFLFVCTKWLLFPTFRVLHSTACCQTGGDVAPTSLVCPSTPLFSVASRCGELSR